MFQPVIFIDRCPECGATLVSQENEATRYCPNDTECPSQIKGKIEHFVSRGAMDIDGLGQETIDQLFHSGLVKSVADLYRLTKGNIAALDRMGEKSAERILSGIEASKTVPFERVLFALGIRFVGATVAKILVKKLHSIDNIMSADVSQLTDISEIGGRIAESIVDYFAKPEHIYLIEFLRQQGLQFRIDEKKLGIQTNKLTGLNIVISGTFEKISRDDLKNLIEQNGGRNVSSISKKTHYVVAGDNMGPAKLEKATQLGVPVISEDEFLKMLE